MKGWKRFAPVWMAIVLALLAARAQASEVTVNFASIDEMDKAGKAVRQALNAWEYAAYNALPQRWSMVEVPRGQSFLISPNVQLLLPDSTNGVTELIVIDDNGPEKGPITEGLENQIGDLRVILIREDSTFAHLLVRSNTRPKVLRDTLDDIDSGIVLSGYENPPQLVISGDPVAVEYASWFLDYLTTGAPVFNAATTAWDHYPPPSFFLEDRQTVSSVPQRSRPSTPGTRFFEEEIIDENEPFSAMVMLRLVRGEASALQSLSTGATYNSAGNNPNDPAYGVSAGAGGGTVKYGSTGDRFLAQLSALQHKGSLHVENETFISVPLGGSAAFRFDGPSGGVNGVLYARLVGKDTVELQMDQRSGDWSFLGGVFTRVRIKDGQTLPVAKSTTSRTTSSSSGPPLVGGIPIIGGALGSSSKSTSSSSYALFATVELQ